MKIRPGHRHEGHGILPHGHRGSAQVVAATIAGLTSNPTYGQVAEIGIQLTGTISNLVGGEAVSHAWTRDGAAIPGAISATYTPVAGDDLGVIRYTPTVDSVEVVSAGYTARYAPPVAGSLAAVNETLGTGAPTVNVAAGFTGSDLTYTEGVAWASISGSTLTINDEARSEVLTITATNSGGAATVDLSVTIAPSGENTILWPADTAVGAGGAATTLPDGTYGEFTVSGGILTANTTPTTIGTYDTGSGVQVVSYRTGNKSIAVRSDAELVAAGPASLCSDAANPDTLILCRPGTVISQATSELFSGSSSTDRTLYGFTTIQGEAAADGNGDYGLEIIKWRAQYFTTSNVGAAGFKLLNFNTNAQSASDTDDPFLFNNQRTTVLELENFKHVGNPYDVNGDYGAKLDIDMLVGGTPQVGDRMNSSDWSDPDDRREVLEWRDNGDGTGTLILNDGSISGGSHNVAALASVTDDAVLTFENVAGTPTGVTATANGVGYDDKPLNSGFISLTGNEAGGYARLKNGRIFHTEGNAVSLRAIEEITIEEVWVESFDGDAFKISSCIPGNDNATKNPTVTIRGCRASLPMANQKHFGNPHGDGWQVQGNAFNWVDFTFEFNLVYDGFTPGNVQPFFFKPLSVHVWTGLIMRGNASATRINANAILLGTATDALCYNNACLQMKQANGSTYPEANDPYISVFGDGNYYGGNLASFAVEGSGTPTEEFNTYEAVNAVSTGLTAFAGMPTGEPHYITSFEDMAIAMAPGASANANAGPYGAAVDRDNYTIDTSYLTNFPTSATITVDTEPDASGLTAATDGESFATIISRLTNTGVATASNSATVTTTIALTSDGSDPVATGDVLSNVRFTYSTPGATSVVRDVAISITVAASSGGGAGITVEQSLVGVNSTSEANTYTGDITIGAGANRVLVVAIHGFTTTAGATPTPVVDFGGVSLDVDVQINNAARSWSAICSLANPATGTGTVTIASTGGQLQRAMAATFIELTGVEQITPVDVVASDNAGGSAVSAVTPGLTTLEDGALVISSIAVDRGAEAANIAVSNGTFLTGSPGETGALGSNDVSFAVASQEVATAGAVTHPYTWTNSDRVAAVIACIKPA